MPRLVLALVVVTLATSVVAWGADFDTWGSVRPDPLPPAISWYGSSGLVRVPVATVPTPLSFSVAAHRVDFAGANQDILNTNVAIVTGLEAGVTYITSTLTPGLNAFTLSSETVLNAKYCLPMTQWLGSGPLVPDVAVGAWDITNELNRSLYVVASLPVRIGQLGGGRSMGVHLGFGNSDEGSTELGDLFAGRALDGLFGGVQIQPLRWLGLSAEYDGADCNFAAKASPTDWLSLDLGTVSGELGWGATVHLGF